MRNRRLLLVALVAVMMRPSASRADSVCGPNGFPNGGQCIIFTGGSAFLQTAQFPASTTVPIQGFNPALGTLVGVGVGLAAQGTMTLTFFNPGPFPDPGYGAKGAMLVDLSTPSGSELISDAIEFHGISPGPLDPGMSTTTTFDSGDVFGAFIDSPPGLAEFTKSATILLPASVPRVIVPLFNDIVTLDSGTMRFDVSVEYDYTPAPIPEPATGILLITAIMVAGPLRWLRPHRSLGDSTN